jgi:signal transduction histidine kinase
VDGDDRSGSLGLGLALVSALAELHGGRVWVEDLPEVGSVFHLLVAAR